MFSTNFKIAMALLIPLAILIAMYKFNPVDIQAINMNIASEKLPRVTAILEGDKRFKDVSGYVYTGQNGAIGLQGSVDKEDDLFLLMKAVAAERLPVAVNWRVRVMKLELKK